MWSNESLGRVGLSINFFQFLMKVRTGIFFRFEFTIENFWTVKLLYEITRYGIKSAK